MGIEEAYILVKAKHPEWNYISAGETKDVFFFVDEESLRCEDESGWYSVNKETGELGIFYVGDEGFLDAFIYELPSFKRVD